MATLNGFDATQVKIEDFDAIPEGDYLCVVDETTWEDTKAGTGKFLKVKLKVVDGGEFNGRILFDRFNLQNPNETAVKIANQSLAKLCLACGVPAPKDSIELHNIPIRVTVKCKKREDNGELGNEVKGYKPRNTAAQTAAAISPPNAGGAKTTAPWAR